MLSACENELLKREVCWAVVIKCVSDITKLIIHHKANAANDETILEMEQVKGEQLQPMDTRELACFLIRFVFFLPSPGSLEQ